MIFPIVLSFIVIFLDLVFAVVAFLTWEPKREKGSLIVILIYILLSLAVCISCIVIAINYPKEYQIDADLSSYTYEVPPASDAPEPVPMAQITFPERTIYPYVHVDKEELVLQVLAEDGFFYYTHYYKGEKLYSMPMTEKWQKIVYEYCNKYDLDYETVLAIGGVETSFDVHRGTVVSKYNSSTYFGLGMVNKYYYEKRTGTTLATERDGINALCDTLRRKLNEFDEDYIHALMAYNGGSAWCRKKLSAGVVSSTYVEKVMTIKDGLEKWRKGQ